MAAAAELAIDTLLVASSGSLSVIDGVSEDVDSKMREVAVAMPLNCELMEGVNVKEEEEVGRVLSELESVADREPLREPEMLLLPLIGPEGKTMLALEVTDAETEPGPVTEAEPEPEKLPEAEAEPEADPLSDTLPEVIVGPEAEALCEPDAD